MTDNDVVSNQAQPQDEPEETMESLMGELLDAEGLNIDFPKAGEIRDGIIASLSEGQILVSVGAKSEGLITGKEYEAIPADILATLSVGKAIPVYVVTPEDQNGNLILSFIRAVEEQSWIDAEALLKSGESFESAVVGYNKGGLLVPMATIRGFIPASQISLSRRLAISGDTPEAKYKEMIGEKINVCVIEVDRERHRLILSERAASNETRDMIRDKVMDDLHEGDIRTGRVTSLAKFGAFVSIGGADGLVHLSEISWDRLEDPSQALKVGDEVKVKIISVDKERRRIGLSIRQLQGDPWSNQIKALKVGQLVEGEITRLTNFGAFAILRLPGDLEGLIHISELSEKRVEHPKEVIKVGEIVPLRIIKIDEENHRIGLSMRRVESAAYADMDWKTLAADYDLNPSTAGETLGEITGHEEALVEEPVVEAAAEPEAEAAAEPEAEAAPTEEKEAE
ncbi:MAG TPA: S1 RNA-binding domain-containing protein [Anaerolineaceae bacterium]|jgi:small subunit ribosomal protein S1|nr:S1 RNA-binding domain-containing protein [Anaerolineaceae bacterium]